VLPSISFVVAGRNDDYGGNFLSRTQSFIDLLAYQLDTCRVDGELIFVEWNPPKDKPLLKDTLAWPKTLRARVFVVSEEMHKRFPNPHNAPIFEHIARNVGIRRSQSQYILATNPDVIYNTKLMEFLSEGSLKSGCFYRADRYDVTVELPSNCSAQEILAFCASHFSKADLRGGSIRVPFPTASKFGRECWEIVRWFHGVADRALRLHRLEDLLYTNAAGSFTLMNRVHWFELRGFPEIPIILHYDAYLVAAAASMGLRQVQLPSSLRLYHLDHGRSWPSSPGAREVYANWARDAKKMLSQRKPTIQNGENWGLGDLELSEYSYGPN